MKVALGLVLAAVLAGCGTNPSTEAPVRSATPAPSPSATVVPTTVAEASVAPVAAPITCLRLADDTCAEMVRLVREAHDAAARAATAIIVADTCPPRVFCDRMYPFDGVVVLVGAGTGGESLAFHVFGVEEPERVSDYDGPLPVDVRALLGA